MAAISSLFGCSACGGSGYVTRWTKQATDATGPTPLPYEEKVPCSCLRLYWQQQQAQSQGTGTSNLFSNEVE